MVEALLAIEALSAGYVAGQPVVDGVSVAVGPAELVAVFGPTLLAIAAKAADERPVRRRLADTKTYQRLGYDPVSLDDGLRSTITWLRQIGRVE